MISIVIPALNEAENLPGLLSRLAREPETHEVVVVDGGSSDNTIAAARAFGVTVVRAEQGRGIQLAAGAARTKGEILVFLHADSIFPQGGLAAIQKALGENPDAPGGNFRLLFDGDDDFSRWLEGFYVWIRARGFYYGDSGIFIRRRVLDSLGGIRPLALMEDYDLVRRMEKAGPTQCIEEPALITSSRRFRGRPPAMIVWGWLKIHVLFLLGVRPERLAGLYDSRRGLEAAGADQDPASFKPQSYS